MSDAEPRIQTLAVMCEILRTTCLDQAIQARKWRSPREEADWRTIADRVLRQLVSPQELLSDAFNEEETTDAA